MLSRYRELFKRTIKSKKGSAMVWIIFCAAIFPLVLCFAIDVSSIASAMNTLSNQADLTALGVADINANKFRYSYSGTREIDWGQAQPRANRIMDEFKRLNPKKFEIVGPPQIVKKSDTGLMVRLKARVKTVFLHNIFPNSAPGGYVVINIESKNAVIGQKKVK